MNFVLERITNPEIEPVTLAEIIQHVNEFSSVSAATQTELTNLIVAGREWAEGFTGRALIDQTWRLTLTNLANDPIPSRYGYYAWSADWWRGNEISLRKSPAIVVVTAASVDPIGTETEIDPATYEIRELKSKWPRLVSIGAAWPTTDLVITFRAGFADRLGSPIQGAEMVPERFKHAIKLWVEAHYDRDKDMMSKLISVAEAVLRPERAELSIA